MEQRLLQYPTTILVYFLRFDAVRFVDVNIQCVTSAGDGSSFAVLS